MCNRTQRGSSKGGGGDGALQEFSVFVLVLKTGASQSTGHTNGGSVAATVNADTILYLYQHYRVPQNMSTAPL